MGEKGEMKRDNRRELSYVVDVLILFLVEEI